MEHEVIECAKELHTEMTKMEVEETATFSSHIDIEIGVKQIKEEPGLVQFVKNELVLLAKEEVLEDSRKDPQPGSKETPPQQQAESQLYVCDECPKVFKSKASFNVHRKYEDSMKFHKCAKQETTKADSSSESYSCNKCWKVFKSEGNLNRHIKHLHGTESYKCTQCSKEFKCEPYLLNHIKYSHGDEHGTELYECTQCNKGFNCKSYFLKHVTKYHRHRSAGSLTAQTATMKEWSGGVGALKNLQVTVHKDHLESICRVHLIRLDNFQCELCDAVYTDKCSLLQHLQSVHRWLFGNFCETNKQQKPAADNKTTSSKYCDQTKTEQDYDEAHLKFCQRQQKHLPQNVFSQHRASSPGHFKCDACEGTFHKSQLLRIHKKLHPLNESKTSATTSSAVAGHCNQSRKEPVKQKPFVCDVCEKGYSSKAGLNFHKCLHLTGKMAFQCDTCDARFAFRSQLTSHKRLHTGEKPYQCDTCDVRFAQRSYLTVHKRLHTGEKRYQCGTCDARFARKSHLTVHKRLHTGEKPYQCDTCDARFARNGTLTLHMRIHTGEKPYQCDRCCKIFAQRSTLTTHMKIHTGEKPYQCDTCDARFANRHVLTRHKTHHRGEKPYQCDTCDARFAFRSSLTSHMRVHIRVHSGEKQKFTWVRRQM